MKAEKYDIIVIGAGAAGLNVASFCNTIGLKVLLIEREAERIGGDCLNFGCIPSKALIHVAKEVYAAHRSDRYGLATHGVVDFKKVRRHIQNAQSEIRSHESVAYFEEKGITVRLGEASFVNHSTIKVNEQLYTAKKIILAVGARPRTLSLPGMAEAEVHTNETIFSLDRLPGRLVVVGGGPIGVELGQAFAMLGSEVSIVTRDKRLLPREDIEIAEIVQQRLIDMNVSLYFGAKPIQFEGRTRLVVELEGGLQHQIGYDACLLAIGREFNFGPLNLDAGGVFLTERGAIATNDYLQTTNHDVFVVGDAVGKHQFTHAAELHAALVLGNLFKPKFLWSKLNTDFMGWVTYTDPEVATFGLSEAALQKRNIPHEVLRVPMADEDRAITDDNRDGLLKLQIEPRHGVILGGSLVSKQAGEIVQELMLAQRHELTLGHLFKKVYPYPTASRINRVAAQKFLGRKLTPMNKRLLRWLY